MTCYDLKSYALAVRLRSKKTLLVEGVSDKKILSRIIKEEEINKGGSEKCVVDDVSMLGREIDFGGLGNKARVERTASVFVNFSSKFNWLVDREWDDIDLMKIPNPIPCPVAKDWGHRTYGHSIENYWFGSDALIAYLKMLHAVDLPSEYFVVLPNRFLFMLRIAAAFSIAASKLRIITSCGGMVGADSVEWLNSEYVPSSKLGCVAAKRGIVEDLTAAIMVELRRPDIRGLAIDSLRWLCHGHLGEEMLRICAANLAAEIGVNSLVVDKIARGFKSEKLAHDADWLVRTGVRNIDPFNKMIEWAV